MNGFRTLSAFTVLACGLAVGGLDAQAAAASQPTRPGASAPASNAGYQASSTGSSSGTATGSITVPKLTCAPKRFAEIDPGLLIAGFQTDSILTAGVQLVLRCQNGTASYLPMFVNPRAHPTPTPITVTPGDTLNIKITDSTSPSGRLTVMVRDGSQMASMSSVGFALQQVFALALTACRPTGPCFPGAAFPRFGTIAYRGVTVDGRTLRQLGATGMDGHNGSTGLIKTTALDSTGAGFKLIWMHG